MSNLICARKYFREHVAHALDKKLFYKIIRLIVVLKVTLGG